MTYDWPQLEPWNIQTPNQMTIPNIGYKANSVYERDAIFDELEKIGYRVYPQNHRLSSSLLVVKSQIDDCDFVSSQKMLDRTAMPSPESFLAAAREALKPKKEYKDLPLIGYQARPDERKAIKKRLKELGLWGGKCFEGSFEVRQLCRSVFREYGGQRKDVFTYATSSKQFIDWIENLAAGRSYDFEDKPKYPTETLHAKCNSPYELRGCIEALHKAGVPVTERSVDGRDDAMYPFIYWSKKNIGQCMKGDSSREVPLSEFMDIFLNPETQVGTVEINGKEIPVVKRETPPKIVGRKYRATSDGLYKRYYIKGDVLKLITDDGLRIPWFWNDRIKDRAPIDMDFVELLPEEPWTAEYKEFDEVWIKGSVTSVSDNSVRVSPYVNLWNDSVSNPAHIKKA